MTKIKICGLSRVEDIHAANELSPDYIGFVFVNASRRCVTVQKAAELRKVLRPEIIPVGVFVNSQIADIIALVKEGVIDMIQLHGNEKVEDEDYIRGLKSRTECDIIAVNRVSGCADYLLFDGQNAGSGEVFDWDTIPNSPTRRQPIFLAGGLDPDNVESAIAKVRPFAVDVSSGVESNGVKDRIKMKIFINRVRKNQN
ncbi:MAG: phosphoribosylanthranilate isomerase [Oscillospiraceae bacterium]|nr:phosphoribosylanthranilate isomerase [Oscillospiraceae bacterium]